MENMKAYFDAEARLHDDLFVSKMGLGEFYDAVEERLGACKKKENILVLGCGSGLEVERIKFPCTVVGMDLSDKMLEVLSAKKLHEGVRLETVCASLLDWDMGTDRYDIVLTCYVMHHFDHAQKLDIYRRIYASLRTGGRFINGDTIAPDRAAEDELYRQALEIYSGEGKPFASLHVDAPFCWEYEKQVLTEAGFGEISLAREWTSTKLYECEK